MNEHVEQSDMRDALLRHANNLRAIMQYTDDTIRSMISPYEADPTLITAEKAKDFEALAMQLSRYDAQIDTALSVTLHDLVVAYAELSGDDEMLIRNLFYKGFALFALENNLFSEEAFSCYKKITSFSDRYTSFGRPTRELIVRSFGNTYINLTHDKLDQYFEELDHTLKFWREVAEPFDPDLPWQRYYISITENMCARIVSVKRSDNYVDPERIEQAYSAISKLFIQSSVTGYINPNPQYTVITTNSLSRLEYFYYALKHYSGRSTLLDFAKELHRIYKSASPSDYSSEGVLKNMHITALFLHYIKSVPADQLSDEKRSEFVDEIEQSTFNYFLGMPDTMSSLSVSRLVTTFLAGRHDIFKPQHFLHLLLSFTVVRHKPTFVHSIMVSKIACTLAEHLLDTCPEYFIGLPGISTAQHAIDNKEAILNFIWHGGVCHDVGKVPYSHIISLSLRKLTDREFLIIKNHPERAVGFLPDRHNFNEEDFEDVVDGLFDFPDNILNFTYLLDIAKGHHKTYDGKGGYPESFDNLSSPVKSIIDIITICDSIDAATDIAGRSYAMGKRLANVVKEISDQSGTRYCPVIANELATCTELYDKVADLLDNYRYKIYHNSQNITSAIASSLLDRTLFDD